MGTKHHRFPESLVGLGLAIAVLCSGVVASQQADRGFEGIVVDGKWVRERDLDEIGNYYGLVIGIDDYRHWTTLRCCANDARAVAEVLKKDYGFKEVVLLLDDEATDEAIKRALGRLRRTVTERDSVLIYYAGHGTLKWGMGYWVPVNGERGDDSHYLEHTSIRGRLNRQWLPARHVLIVSDSCYAAALFEKADTLPEATPDYVAQALRTPSRKCLSSGGLHPVADGRPGGHSVFARYFLQALRKPKRCVFAISDVFPTLRENVNINSMRIPGRGGQDHAQVPELGTLPQSGHEVGGEFVFFYRRGTGGVVPTFKFILRSAPTDAQVVVNDRPRGTTPFEADLEVGKEYRTVVAKPGHADWERRLVWTKPESLELVARLQPVGGRDTRLRIALDYLKRGDLDVGRRLLQDVSTGDSADAIRALAELFAMDLKQERIAKARKWADELRRRFPESAESTEAEQTLRDHALSKAPEQKSSSPESGSVPVHFEFKEGALLPGFEDTFVVPTGDRDQWGNPVVTRNGSRTDPQTGWPYEVWLQEGTRTRVVEREKGWLSKTMVRQTISVQMPRMEFVLVSPGEFWMGSPRGEQSRDEGESQHRVRLTKPFYLAKYEVTQAQWTAVMGNRPWSGLVYAKFYVRRNVRNPAVYVGWDDCQQFLRKLGSGFRLPTEAEWEYACRAGSTSAYCFGDRKGKLGDYAWYEDNAWGVAEKYAHGVGLKESNPWGLYDMHGNVWEWCSDWHGDYPSDSVTDPTGSARGSGRVFRGGCFRKGAGRCRSAHREWHGPGYCDESIGLRPSRSLP